MESKKWNDIASQFDLPERQAKVKQLLKIHDPDAELWCICRSSDCSTFMIGCDNCDEWYHGTCIGLKERESKKIKKYYCDKCRAEDPSLEVQYKPQYAEQMARKKQKRLRVDEEADAAIDSETANSKKQKLSDAVMTETPKQKSTAETPSRQPKSVPRPSPAHSQRVKAEPSPVVEDVIAQVQQCYGPGCCEHVPSSRPGSKYCSDDCGMNLARNRIFETLPWRVSQWVSAPSSADVRNHKELELVRQERQVLHAHLALLDKKKAKLEELIKRAKNTPPCLNDRDWAGSEGVDASEESAAEGGNSKCNEEAQLDCVSCGNPQPPKTAFRHMERCFARLECQTTCWSIMSTRIEGDSMLCDFYSPQLNMYCKRLKHICPEHYKEDKLETEVCGCPLVVPGGSPLYEVSYAGSGDDLDCSSQYSEFCRQLKSRCHRHPSWERLRRANIDLERFKLWSRLEELMERENSVRYALSQRAGVVALMLNETIDCDPNVPIVSSKRQEQQQSTPAASPHIVPPPPNEHQYCSVSGSNMKMDATS